MSVTSKGVYNINTVSGTNFVFILPNFPNLNFTVQSANLPGVFGSHIELPTPLGKFNNGYDKLEYESLMVEFLVDESLNNWREVYNWMRALAPTHLFSGSNQYKLWKDANKELASPATLYILTNSNNINIKVEFKNLFPISVSGIDFSAQDTTDVKKHAKVQFVYDWYDISVNDSYNDITVPGNAIR